MRRIVLLFIVVVYSCGNVATKKEKNDVVQHPEGMAFPSSPSKVGAIEPPQGFIRTSTSEGSYTHYLRSLSLDTLDNVVHLYNGEEKINQSAHFAILTIDVGEGIYNNARML